MRVYRAEQPPTYSCLRGGGGRRATTDGRSCMERKLLRRFLPVQLAHSSRSPDTPRSLSATSTRTAASAALTSSHAGPRPSAPDPGRRWCKPCVANARAKGPPLQASAGTPPLPCRVCVCRKHATARRASYARPTVYRYSRAQQCWCHHPLGAKPGASGCRRRRAAHWTMHQRQGEGPRRGACWHHRGPTISTARSARLATRRLRLLFAGD